MIVGRMRSAGGWLKQHHKRVLVMGIGGLLLVMTVVQLRYPGDMLLPFSSIDGLQVGAWNKAAATAQLDTQYRETPIDIYFGDTTKPYRSPNPVDIGVSVKNEERISALEYPWYLRIAPASLFWAHLVLEAKEPTYAYDSSIRDAYIAKEWGDSCNVAPKDASLKVVDSSIEVVKGSAGGTCELADIVKMLSTVKVSITDDTDVTIPVDVIPAAISDEVATTMAREIETHVEGGVDIVVGDETIAVSHDMLISWLDFTAVDGKLDYTFSAERAGEYLNEQLASKVARSAGVTKISTYNFLETSRQTGVSGQALDVVGTLARIKAYIHDELDTVTPATTVIAPRVEYIRSYSSNYEGLAALMQNFATTHSGSYGIALTELSGQYRRATYNGTKSFTTASTYKLFVAYSALLRVESGAWKWTDHISGGRDLAKCFDDMIVVSDNACALAMLQKIGFTNITNEAHAIGCTRTSFLGSDGIKTSAEDLALLLASLQTGQILSQQSSRDTLINAMKRNIYRQGIPKGIDAVVADKVGFLDGLLHDAAIVYASTGPYVLVILTDGSSWANIAQLTREIEALRLQ
jgi:beta-lactamase class A